MSLIGETVCRSCGSSPIRDCGSRLCRGCVVSLNLCTRCEHEPRSRGHRWCLRCKSAWARLHRPRYAQFSDEQRRRANARSYLNTYVSRGLLCRPEVCERCKVQSEIQAHHHDYDKPLEVVWLCLDCHREHHAATVPG